ncbi:MAG: hypothetical protein V7609_2153 [Verrucomicrobiota bacterium]
MTSSFSRDLLRALIVYLFCASAALAQQSTVEVRSPSAKLLDTAPGRIVTASVVVANRGTEAAEFSERMVLPPGCQRVAPPEVPFRLEPGGQIVRVLAVFVPADMRAGSSVFRYFAESRRDPSSSASVDFTVRVTPVDDLVFLIEPRPDVILAGDTFSIKLHVTNRGNSRVAVQLAHRSSLGFPISVAASSFALEAGATREIIATIKTDKSFAKHSSHAATFDVTATSASGKVLVLSQASVAEMIPLISGDRDPFHHFRMVLREMMLAQTGHAPQLQAELSGSGSLDEAGKHRLDFLLRGPDVQSASLSGERDEYGASYHGENWDVDLGDRIYSLSPLTEKRSLGRGAGLRWHDGATSAGVFYMTTRFRQENTEEFGAFLRQDWTERFSLQANFLRKTGAQFPGEALPQNIISLESRYHIAKLLDLRVEAGASRGDEGKTDFAYRIDARGELPGKIHYAVEQVRAGPDFNGYYHDTETTYASVAKAITPTLRVHGSLNRYAGNLALNDVRSTVVNREDSWSAGANYALTKQTELSLDWNRTKREDILAPAAYDFTENSVRLGGSHNFGALQVQGSLDAGTLDNSLTGESGPFQRYNAVVNWRPTPRQTYSVFGSYGPSSFTGSADKSINFGASAGWQVSDRFDARVCYAHNQFDGLTGREQDQAVATLRYEFEDKRSLSLVARWSGALSRKDRSAPNEAALLVTYSVPLSLPVSRKSSIGQLQGRVYDVTKGPVAGLPRVVVQVGEQFAVTDSTGFYEFPALKPGAAEVKILPDSLSPNFTMAVPLPMKINIPRADTALIDLKATPACSLSVRMTRYEFADGNAMQTTGTLRETGGLEAAVVEITNGRETWRAQTDRTGAVSFQRLAAGPWKLRVAGNALPALHTIEQPERSLALKPGESQQVLLRVVPHRRTLRLLDRGAIR